MKGSRLEKKQPSNQPPIISTFDENDVGDETQRRFLYQHAYGVILLLSAFREEKLYKAIWCEHHEDLLCEGNNGLFDGYQIKTRQSEDGAWKLNDEALKKSFKRFVLLNEQFPSSINELVFVSNATFDNPSLQIKDETRLRRSPRRFLDVIAKAPSHESLPSPFNQTFRELTEYCECKEIHLFTTLKKIRLVKGPTLEAFEAEISSNHVAHIQECRNLPIPKINAIRDELINCFHRASSLVVDDPRKHTMYVGMKTVENPMVQAKRVRVEAVKECIQNHASLPFRYAPIQTELRPQKRDQYNILSKKLSRGGLADQFCTMQRRTLTAERKLFELSLEDPDRFTTVLNQLECVVRAECDEASLKASLNGDLWGREMLVGVQERLRRISYEEPRTVESMQYEILIGIAGLLTEECQVWWSDKFDVGDAA